MQGRHRPESNSGAEDKVMKFTRKDRGFMRSLKAKGTAVGPVTQEMINLAVEKYETACRICGHEPEEIMWADFIGSARKELTKNNKRKGER